MLTSEQLKHLLANLLKEEKHTDRDSSFIPAKAAHAIVLTFKGASGHSSRTEPS